MEVFVIYKIFVVRDSFKGWWAVVTEEDSNIIQVCGMRNKEGEGLYFEAEAYHLETWCKRNNLDYIVFNRKETFTI